MAEKEWGIKRVCLSCGTRFYDFNESPIVCPFCEAVFDPEHLSKRKSKIITDKSSEIENIKLDLDDDLSDEDEDLVGVDESDEDGLQIDNRE